MTNGNLLRIIKVLYKYTFRQFKNEEVLTMLLNKYVRHSKTSNKNFFFIQIGSNNGKNNDPIFNLVKDYNIKGILVEPVPYIYEKLQENYKRKEGLVFENVAVGKPSEDLKFYRIKKVENTEMPYWYDQLGSFNKEVILKHKNHIPNLEDLLIEEPVQVRSFDYLTQKHHVKRINLIHIDTEGYDFEVLKMINFKDVEIDMILFENNHLSDADYSAGIALLKSNNFTRIVKLGHDTMCIHENKKDFLPHLDKVLKYRK